ncbi:hypothetical protein SAMN04489727_1862 [Amycolatopsis tolypomycina]|uniref:Secreted protein n=2 Tax=Amycolatopsis tolypomycina TaxID=208445 RepID=A0A1H4JGY5_9PSEU|nr:hypothetical protein SAMN04489727_1862 [Amycolatopsis tolypomycina]
MQPRGRLLRLVGMRYLVGFAVLAAVTTGCAGAGAGPEQACTAIGMPVGISLSIPSPDGVTKATLEACWRGQCVTRDLGLYPETSAGATTCTGTGPDDSCGTSARPTGGLHGFADIPGLPAEPVKVTVRFDDGKPHTVEVTPAFGEPNGPGCGTGGPQAQLVAGEGHELRVR